MTVSVTIIICAYTLKRWNLLCQAVASAQAQTRRPEQIIICVDHNSELAVKAASVWDRSNSEEPDISVVENVYPGRLGSARNTAIELAKGDILAFLDDDAQASPTWLQELVRVYQEDHRAVAVGGAPLPRFQRPRPGWFPREFDWVFGCAYEGLPNVRANVRHLIGASMSARREALVAIGGFHSDDHDDMDMCHRISNHYGAESVVYEPRATVSHFVSAERLTWSYFWRRCFYVNRSKVVAFADMAEAGNLVAELRFVRHAIFVRLPGLLRQSRTGSLDALAQAFCMLSGIALAGSGHVVGKFQLVRGRSYTSLTTGLTAH